MKKKLLLGLVILTVCIIAGGLYITGSIGSVIGKLDDIITLHQVEMQRNKLLSEVKALQAGLLLEMYRTPSELQVFRQRIKNMKETALSCFDCHHTERVTKKIVHWRGEIEKYETKLQNLANQDVEHVDLAAERKVAFEDGQHILVEIGNFLAASTDALAKKTELVQKNISKTKITLTVFILAAPFVAIGFVLLFIRHFTSQFGILLDATKKIGRGSRSHRVTGLKDEFKVLGDSFNEMSESLVKQLYNVEQAQRRYKQLFDSAGDAIFILDIEGQNPGRIVSANKAAADMHGYSVSELHGLHISDLDAPESAAKIQERVDRILKGEWINEEITHVRQDGRTFPVEMSAGLLEYDKRKYILAFDRDISERKLVENTLIESEERHRTVLETVPDPIMVYNETDDVTYVNPAFCAVFGWTLSEVQAKDFDFVPQTSQSEVQLVLEKIEKNEEFSGHETKRLTKNGEIVHVSMSGAVFTDSQGNPLGKVITMQNITQRKQTEEELKYIAYHDLLTGLPNRKSFYITLEDILGNNQQRRTEDKEIWALLFMDLDRFKDINDTLGHDVGDELLRTVSQRIKSCLRKSDHIFRLGGDEFTVILTSLAEDIDVARVAEKIRKRLERPIFLKGHELHVSISIGISVHPTDGLDVERLVKNADMAMYEAKKEGNRHRFFTEEMNIKALQRMKIESGLRTAIRNKQLHLYYQPLVDMEHKLMGMEALLRWQHPELGLVMPTEFIPIAEETGAILEIGEWVLNQACTHVKKWLSNGHSNLYVSVNLSARQFGQAELVQTVMKAVQTAGIKPENLRLEVTESCIMEKPDEAVVKMANLRKKGIRFSIDDFGTGYSSLNYLKRLPIDTLKIDRSFVSDVVNNRDDQEIIKTIIAMAENLRLETLAEGIETSEQRELLMDNGCHMMQGFYFGRPMPVAEFEAMLADKLKDGQVIIEVSGNGSKRDRVPDNQVAQ